MFEKFVIYGLGKSGIEAAKYLSLQGNFVVLCDDNPLAISNSRQKIDSKQNIKFVENSQISDEINQKTAVIFAPGIPLFYPKKHPILEIIKQKKATLMCDLELFYLLNKTKNYIAVTGTNAKSTSCSLIDFALNKIGENSFLAGNIGTPAFELIQKKDFDLTQNIAFELSSFQLDLIQKSHFGVACLTNISPDHIDRHGNFENYVNSKKRIFFNQGKNDFAIINIDDFGSKKIYDELKNDDNFDANLIAISRQKSAKNAIIISGGKIHNKIDDNDFIFETKNAILKGVHNQENIALAFAAIYCFLRKKGLVSKQLQEKIIAAILEFKGLKHRSQILGKINNVNFINDSKATNANSVQKALQSYDNIFWILGGRKKDDGLESLVPHFSKIQKAYLIGEASDDFADFLQKNNVKYEKCFDLENAFNKSYFEAKNSGLENANILLSPACSSFDQWRNFEERGDYFCKLFNEIAKS